MKCHRLLVYLQDRENRSQVYMKVITSRENSTYKNACKLLRKKSRDQSGRYLLEGMKPLRDALETGLMIEKIFACEGTDLPDWIPEDRALYLEKNLFRALSDTVTSQGIIAVAEKPGLDAAAFLAAAGGSPCKGRPAPGHIVILDRLQDPGNAGTIIRTAEAAGFSGILCVSGSVDLYSPKVVRSAAGSLLRMPVLTDVSEEEAIRLMRESGRQLTVTALEKAEDCFAASVQGPCALVIGNEGRGVSPGFLAAADVRLTIPMAGKIESLNAAVAAGILMYRISRGR